MDNNKDIIRFVALLFFLIAVNGNIFAFVKWPRSVHVASPLLILFAFSTYLFVLRIWKKHQTERRTRSRRSYLGAAFFFDRYSVATGYPEAVTRSNNQSTQLPCRHSENISQTEESVTMATTAAAENHPNRNIVPYQPEGPLYILGEERISRYTIYCAVKRLASLSSRKNTGGTTSAQCAGKLSAQLRAQSVRMLPEVTSTLDAITSGVNLQYTGSIDSRLYKSLLIFLEIKLHDLRYGNPRHDCSERPECDPYCILPIYARRCLPDAKVNSILTSIKNRIDANPDLISTSIKATASNVLRHVTTLARYEYQDCINVLLAMAGHNPTIFNPKVAIDSKLFEGLFDMFRYYDYERLAQVSNVDVSRIDKRPFNPWLKDDASAALFRELGLQNTSTNSDNTVNGRIQDYDLFKLVKQVMSYMNRNNATGRTVQGIAGEVLHKLQGHPEALSTNPALMYSLNVIKEATHVDQSPSNSQRKLCECLLSCFRFRLMELSKAESSRHSCQTRMECSAYCILPIHCKEDVEESQIVVLYQRVKAVIETNPALIATSSSGCESETAVNVLKYMASIGEPSSALKHVLYAMAGHHETIFNPCSFVDYRIYELLFDLFRSYYYTNISARNGGRCPVSYKTSSLPLRDILTSNRLKDIIDRISPVAASSITVGGTSVGSTTSTRSARQIGAVHNRTPNRSTTAMTNRTPITTRPETRAQNRAEEENRWPARAAFGSGTTNRSECTMTNIIPPPEVSGLGQQNSRLRFVPENTLLAPEAHSSGNRTSLSERDRENYRGAPPSYQSIEFASRSATQPLIGSTGNRHTDGDGNGGLPSYEQVLAWNSGTI